MVVVKLMHVFIDGIIGTGMIATAGWGFAIGPQAALCFLNSGSQSFIAFLSACLGWYIFGDRVVGTSSPDKPSSVSVSSFISADTVSSKRNKRKVNLIMRL